MLKTYVICITRNRKNGKRKEELRFKAETDEEALRLFPGYVKVIKQNKDVHLKKIELFTGDWKELSSIDINMIFD